MPKYNDPIKEARRYVANAKELLRNNTKVEGDKYDDEKYVRMAGDTAWKGCLIALESVFSVKADKGEERVKINNYKDAVSKRDKKLLGLLIEGYNFLHLYMGYDGSSDTYIVKKGLNLAKELIDKCENMRPKAKA